MTPRQERDFFEERAAILEYDAGMTRAAAEKLATTLLEKEREADRLRRSHRRQEEGA